MTRSIAPLLAAACNLARCIAAALALGQSGNALATLPACPAQDAVYFHETAGSVGWMSSHWVNCLEAQAGTLLTGKTSEGAFEAAMRACDGTYTSTWENPLEWGAWNGQRHFKFCDCIDQPPGFFGLDCRAKQWRSDTPTEPSCPDPAIWISNPMLAESGCRTTQWFVTVQEPDFQNLGDEDPQSCPTCNVGNPINAATGNKTLSEVDYKGTGPFPLTFRRYYNSQDTRFTGLGRSWRRQYARVLRKDFATPPTYTQGSANNSQLYNSKQDACQQGWLQVRAQSPGLATTTATFANDICTLKEGNVVRGALNLHTNSDVAAPNPPLVAIQSDREDGRSYRFVKSGSSFVAPIGATAKLEQIANGYRLTDNDIVEEYDTNGRLNLVRHSSGVTHWLTYPTNGIVITDSFGRSLQITVNGAGRIATLTDPDGKIYEYGYDGANELLKSVTYPDDTSRTYHHENASFPYLLTGITDENLERFATYTYDAMGRGKISEHAGGVNRVEITYNANGTATVKDALNTERVYEFEQVASGRRKVSGMSEPCDSCSSVLDATYNANGFPESRTDRNGNVTTYVFNARGLEESRTEAFGTPLARTITTQWDPVLRVPSQVDEPGRRTTFTYWLTTNLPNTKTVTDTVTGESRTTTWTYLERGTAPNIQYLLETVDGSRADVADVTTYSYHPNGDLATITDALAHQTQIPDYDAHGNPKRTIDPNGVQTLLTYDLRQRLRTRTIGTATTTFDYDNGGQLKKATLPDNSYVEYSYDDAHRLSEVKDNLGNYIRYTLDLRGNRTKEEVFDSEDALRRVQSKVFDELGRLKQIKNASNQVVTEFGYDPQGNRTSETQAGNFTAAHTPDALNRIVESKDAKDGVTKYEYNALDQLVSVEDPSQLVTEYTINALGDVKKIESPDSGVTLQTYDSGGNRATETNAGNFTTTFTFDALNRIKTRSGDVYDQVTYHYDGTNYSGTVPYGIGRLTGVDDLSAEYTFFYDAPGNLIREVKRVKNTEGIFFAHGTFVTKYEYDLADRLISITYPSGRSVSYVRDAAGRIAYAETADGNGNVSTLASDLTYEPFGSAGSQTLGNGVSVQHEFDQDGRVERISSGTLLDLTYGYDLLSNVDTVTDALSTARDQTLDYDELSRLTSASGSYGVLGYTYNDTGDRTSETRSGQTTTYSYQAGTHRLMHSYDWYNYNERGLVTLKRDQHFVYSNTGNWPVYVWKSFIRQDPMADFRYNYQRQRILQRWRLPYYPHPDASVTLISHYDLQGNLIAETCADGRPLVEYAYLDGKPLALWGYPRPSPNSTYFEWWEQATNFCVNAFVQSYDLNASTSGNPYLVNSSTRLLLHFDVEEASPPSATITTPDDGPDSLDATLEGSPVPALVLSPSSGFGKALQFDGVQRGPTADQRAVVAADDNHALAGTDRWSLDIKIAPQVLPPTPGELYIIAMRHPSGPGLLNDWQLSMTKASTADDPDQAQVTFTFQYWGNNTPITGMSTIINFGQRTWGLLRNKSVDIRITFDRSQPVPFLFFVDGTLAATSHVPANVGSVLYPLRLGSHFNLSRAWGGSIDELRISSVTGAEASLDGLTNNIDPTPLQQYYYLNDHLGTPQKLLDEHGTVVWDAVYEPFGGATVNTELVINNLRLPGQYYDAMYTTGAAGEQWGLYYNWNRIYDPGAGRYLQTDPLGLKAGLNLYAYVSNNPVAFVDVDGRAARRRTDEPDVTKICDYYDGVCKKSGGKCNYHCKTAPLLCSNPDLIPSLWLGVSKDQINCIRTCLIEEDKKAQQQLPKSDCPSCVPNDVINQYHDTCYAKCGVGPWRFPGVGAFGN